MHIYEQHLDANAANFVPLSPISMLRRAAMVYGDKAAGRYGERRLNWREVFYRSASRGAAAINARGIGKGDTVAIVSANIPEMVEAHYAILRGFESGAHPRQRRRAVDAATIAFILEHGEASMVIVDKEFGPVTEEALALMAHQPTVIHIDDTNYDGGKLLVKKVTKLAINA